MLLDPFHDRFIYILNVLKHIFSIHESQGHKYLNGRFPSNAAAPWQLSISLLPFNSIDVVHIPVHSLSIVQNALEFFYQVHMSYILTTVFLIPQVDMASQKRPAEEGLIKNPVERLRTDVTLLQDQVSSLLHTWPISGGPKGQSGIPSLRRVRRDLHCSFRSGGVLLQQENWLRPRNDQMGIPRGKEAWI